MSTIQKRRTVIKAIAAIGVGTLLLDHMALAAAQSLADLKK